MFRALFSHVSQLQLLKRLLDPLSPPINFVLHIVRVLFAFEVDGERQCTLPLGPLYVIFRDGSLLNTAFSVPREIHGHI